MKFLKRFFSFTKLFPELGPKERIRKILEVYLNPVFESAGYVLDKSKLRFRKKGDDFIINVEFQRNLNNRRGEVVAFIINVFIRSARYDRWLIKHEKKNEVGAYDYFRADCIEKWSDVYCKAGGWYDLEANDNEAIVKDIIENLNQVAFPHIEKMSDHRAFIDQTMSKRHFGRAPLLLDLSCMIGDKEKAKEVLRWFMGCDEEIRKRMDPVTQRCMDRWQSDFEDQFDQYT